MRTILGVAPNIDVLIKDIRHQALLVANQLVGSMGRSSKARVAGRATNRKTPSRTAISSSSPLGMMALHLLAQWRKSGRKGIVFLSENESRAERLGAVIHALDPSCDVLVFPRLNTLPFDQLEHHMKSRVDEARC